MAAARPGGTGLRHGTTLAARTRRRDDEMQAGNSGRRAERGGFGFEGAGALLVAEGSVGADEVVEGGGDDGAVERGVGGEHGRDELPDFVPGRDGLGDDALQSVR